MQLRPVATVTARLNPPVMVGPGPYGVRVFIQVADGTLDGDGLAGTVLPGGGDWALLGTDGWCRIDVRTMFATADGATIYAQLPGLLELTDAVQAALAAGTATAFDDQYFRVTPQLETGDERYRWVNQAVFLGEGRFVDGFGLQYRMFQVE